MQNTKWDYPTLLNILKQFIHLESHLEKHEICHKLRKHKISSLTSFFYNKNFWVNIFEKGHYENEIINFQKEFIQILNNNLIIDDFFIKKIIEIFFLKMD